MMEDRSGFGGRLAERFPGKTLTHFALFLLVGLALSFKSLAYGWFWDDLHLIRVFSPAELVGTFAGNYDVDGYENAGYRPLMVLFDHTRAVVFGENTVAQRLFEIALFAAFLTLFSNFAARLGVSHAATALGGVLALCSRYNWFNLVWPTDAIHAFTGLWVMLSALMLFAHLDKPSFWKLGLFAILGGASLLVREDAIATFPIIVGSGFFYIMHSRGWDELTFSRIRSFWTNREFEPARKTVVALGMAALLLLLVALFYFFLRRVLVPQAPFALDWMGWYYHVWLSLYPMGQPSALLGDRWIHDVWKVVLALLGLATLFVVSQRSRLQSLWWLACLVISASPGLTTARVNLLFFPILFFSTWLGTIFTELAFRSRWLALGVMIVVTALVLVSSDRNMVAQEVMHPQSLGQLAEAYDVIRHPSATIPAVRLAKIHAEWQQLGIYSIAEFQSTYNLLLEQAKADGRRHPNVENEPFIPVYTTLEP